VSVVVVPLFGLFAAGQGCPKSCTGRPDAVSHVDTEHVGQPTFITQFDDGLTMELSAQRH
jgi:hypothetical protein